MTFAVRFLEILENGIHFELRFLNRIFVRCPFANQYKLRSSRDFQEPESSG
jgi:hypothetical protein